MKKEDKISEGEELIKEFLEEKDIKFKQQYTLSNLKYDQSRSYRVSDFYLSQYKVHIEFLGKWNQDKYRQRYREKKEIYKRNNIPCVYLYPDNLGILDWLFKRRLKEELKKYPNLKWQLLKYNLKIFLDEFGPTIIILAVLVYGIKEIILRLIIIFLLVLTIYKAIKEIFFK